METSQEIEFLQVLLPLVGVAFIIAVGVIFMYQQFQKNIIRQQLQKEEMKSQYQKELLQNTIKVQEQERERIARDLHDELAASLSIAYLQLTHLEEQQTKNSEEIANISKTIKTTLTSTRRISHELMPLHLSEQGLEKALSDRLEKVQASQQIDTHIAISDLCREISKFIQVALYRIYSELINNTIKHAEASTIEISIICENDQLFCRYNDDGKGLSEDFLNKGIGLQNLETRVNTLHGTLELGNADQGGFFCKMIIPLL